MHSHMDAAGIYNNILHFAGKIERYFFGIARRVSVLRKGWVVASGNSDEHKSYRSSFIRVP